MHIRFAEPQDIASLAELVDAGQSVTWTEADLGGWLVILDDTQMMAAVQICGTRPVGRLEQLSVREGLDLRVRAALVKTLTAAGLDCLHKLGCQIAVAFVAQHNNGFKRMLKKKLGAEVINHGNLLAVRFK